MKSSEYKSLELKARIDEAYRLAVKEAAKVYDAKALHRRNVAEGLVQPRTM